MKDIIIFKKFGEFLGVEFACAVGAQSVDLEPCPGFEVGEVVFGVA